MSKEEKPLVNYMNTLEEGVTNGDTGSLDIPNFSGSEEAMRNASPLPLLVGGGQGAERTELLSPKQALLAEDFGRRAEGLPITNSEGDRRSPEEFGITDSVSEGPETTILPSLFAKGTEIFKDWICPISFKLMVDPVVAQDGHTYERTEIEKWLQNNSTSPMDRSQITNKKLYKNIGLKGAIQLWKNNNPDLVKEDEQLDRQIDMTSLRIKPSPSPSQLPRQSPFITISTVSLPGWNQIHGMLSRSSSQNFSPRISQLMRNNSSSRVIPV